MSNYRTNRNYTLIEELPDLEELERNQPPPSNGLNMVPPDNAYQVQKFIRNNTFDPPIESGMSQYQPERQQPVRQEIIQQFIQPPPPPPSFIMEEPRMFEPPSMNEHRHNMMGMGMNELNCINVAEHTTNCVVCSRLYQQNNAGYIVVIILLAIICILLLKRVLNV